MMNDIIFFALSFFSVAGAATMLYHRNPIYCAFGLLICVLGIGGLFAGLSATFMFMVQIIVYAGAIMTLILFILMFLNIKEEDLPPEPNKKQLILIGIILMIPINLVVFKAVDALPNANMDIIQNNFGDIKSLGLQLYRNWLLPFELISILLLVALIGSVVLVRKRGLNK